ncbi:ClpXP adapter SpxH family protein [Metabacillus arenae]|uniref:ClpXP adapter protein SpxH n=1 Tax=Metabacillus arenae TaxID=2771434 RepID=A0A926NGL3_9BACI|nr:ClpXP adapter SpxH family protein [Metabacillus arenae]MBD1383069.1 DsbA family protein [Metabacillus arenae]
MLFNSGQEKNKIFFSHCQGHSKKPLEIYMFIDPLCPECWALEPIIKKLQIQYGRFFTLRHIISGKIAALNVTKRKKPEKLAEAWEKTGSRSGMSCDGNIWFENPINSPYIASVAIKAAELQGRRAGIRFLRKMQEVLFLEKQNIAQESVLIEIAKEINLDVDLFQTDLHSPSAIKALQCDLKITSEMEVTEIPTLAFFNQRVEDEGLKVTGYYSYDLYEQVLFEMLEDIPRPSENPPLEVFLHYYKFVASKEIAVVYNMTMDEVEKEMKKFILARKAERVPVKHATFWRYIE